MKKVILAALLASGVSASAQAATLVHAYEFNGTGVTTAIDSVGGVNGTLFGNANISGGYLHLDGDGDYVELDPIFPSSSSAFSVFFTFTGHNPQSNYTEVVSQNGSAFYIGQDPGGNIRISDVYLNTGVAFPSNGGTHSFLMTSITGSTQLFIDGGLVFSGNSAVGSSGTGAARFGRQYGPYNEWFQGSIDTIRVFDGIATYAEASNIGSGGAVPEPASWALMIGGFGAVGMASRRRRRSVAVTA